jgi:glycosyltransferase involved in cell wall biosynthesis
MIRRHRPDPAIARVLFLQSSPHFAADAQVHAALMRHLPNEGIGVHVAYNGADRVGAAVYAQIPGVSRLETGFGPRRAAHGLAGMLRLALIDAPATVIQLARLSWYARRQHITAVHATEKAREAIFAWIVARLSGAAVVIHLHVKVEPWFSAPTRFVMRHADRLIAISEFVASSAEAMGFDRAKVRVVLNALAPQGTIGGAGDVDRAAARASLVDELQLDPSARIVSIVARINEWKGHVELLGAVAALPPECPAVTVLVVGTDDGTEQAVRACADRLGLAARVRFLGFRRDVERIMRASDVYAMPSHEEPFGLVYLEAMAAGTPVVALRSGGTPEAVIDGETGLLAERGDELSLVANLARLLTDRDLAERMGAAGVRHVAERFAPSRLGADMAAVYRELGARRLTRSAGG